MVKKSWADKLKDNKNLGCVLKLKPNFPCKNSLLKMGAKMGDKVVLVQPREIERIMKRVPRGKLITMCELSRKAAKKHNVKYSCTLINGIFMNIVANAAEEAKAKGVKNTTPYWRTLKTDGFLNEKYPGGAIAQKRRLEKEGFKVIPRGKKFSVKDFEKYLVRV